MNAGKLLLGVLAGIAGGALLGILIAPDKGSETRRKVSKKSEEFTESVKGKLDEILDSVSSKYEKIKEDITGKNGKEKTVSPKEAI